MNLKKVPTFTDLILAPMWEKRREKGKRDEFLYLFGTMTVVQ